MVLIRAAEFLIQDPGASCGDPGSPFLKNSGNMTSGAPRKVWLTLLLVFGMSRWELQSDLDKTVVRVAFPLVCTGVNTGMGGVLRWLDGACL